MTGPLQGLRVIEMVGLGPAPFCAMMLSDMGAEVIRIDQKRKSSAAVFPMLDTRFDVLARGRRSIALDLKNPAGAAALHRLVAGADALIEGYRPGVMERLGLAWNVQRRSTAPVRDARAALRPAMPMATAGAADMTGVLVQAEAPAKAREGAGADVA